MVRGMRKQMQLKINNLNLESSDLVLEVSQWTLDAGLKLFTLQGQGRVVYDVPLFLLPDLVPKVLDISWDSTLTSNFGRQMRVPIKIENNRTEGRLKESLLGTPCLTPRS